MPNILDLVNPHFLCSLLWVHVWIQKILTGAPDVVFVVVLFCHQHTGIPQSVVWTFLEKQLDPMGPILGPIASFNLLIVAVPRYAEHSFRSFTEPISGRLSFYVANMISETNFTIFLFVITLYLTERNF